MKKLFMILPLVLLFCFTFSCQQAEEVAEEPVDVEADVEALKKIEEEWGAALASGDVEKILSFYADNAVNIPSNEPALIGKETFRELLQQVHSQFITEEHDSTVEDIQVSCDLAFTRGTETSIRTPKAGGESIEVKTNWVTIYRKQSDGTWKCICNIWSDENLISPTQSEE